MKEELYVVHVRYQPNPRSKEYAYLYDPAKLTLKRGDEILVPVGSAGKRARCEVSRVKGLVSNLDNGIEYKVLDPEDTATSKALIEQANNLCKGTKPKSTEESWDDLTRAIEDF